MSVPQDQLQRAITAARAREAQGYFTKVKAGDQKAASLFVRLVVLDLNPSGKESDFGWLSKSPGETQVDGFAEDAICYTADPSNRENVLDMVNGAGAPNASIGGAVKPRREHNHWVKPVPLSQDQLDYLLEGAQPEPGPAPIIPSYEALGGDAFFRAMIGVPLQADYLMAGQTLNDGSAVWFSRTTYSLMAALAGSNGAPVDVNGIVKKHRNEWRAILGLPPV